ncbi:MAG: AAA family ATPase [Pseudomonadales bacterium]|jgi:hypothetical protein|nr:AAA family ATPase [Pseudomonadales bacterium]
MPSMKPEDRCFILLFGPPAVGKMAVGKDIQRLTGIPLFHNHLAIEPVLRLFPHGSPAFRRLVDGFRDNVFREAAASDLPGLIFTFVWDFSDASDAQYVASVCDVFADAGARILLVELKAGLEVRLRRNRGASRLREKPSKRDVAAAEKRLLASEESHQMNSRAPLALPWEHLLIDTTHLSSLDTARQIVSHLGLPERPDGTRTPDMK